MKPKAARRGDRPNAFLPYALLAGLLLLLAACVPASAPATFKLGLVAPFSGRDAALGYNMLVAARLALEGRNGRGGVGGSYIEIVAQDDHGEAARGATEARKMALDPQVLAVVGHPFGDSALAASSIYRESGLPALLTGPALLAKDFGGSPAFQAAGPPVMLTVPPRQEDFGGPPVFQLGPSAAELAQQAALFVASRGRGVLLAVKAGPGGPNTPVSAGGQLAELIGGAARQGGLTVHGGYGVVPGGEELMAVQVKDMKKLPDLRVDVVYYDGSYVQGAAFLTALRGQGVGSTFLGGPGLAYPDFLKLAGPAAEGAYYLSTAPDPARLEAARGFVAAYRASAGTDPWPQSLQVYDAVSAVLDALDRGAKTGRKPGREVLLQGLDGIRYAGLSGTISFDQWGNQVGAPGNVNHIERMTWPGS